uniref:Uncharacterized protein n=1 Tax=Timema monikensis TaxID=170555 RepID=A0A7R9EH25_9NEOP|nr:unnamed protein product [Timema monikensis]
MDEALAVVIKKQFQTNEEPQEPDFTRDVTRTIPPPPGLVLQLENQSKPAKTSDPILDIGRVHSPPKGPIAHLSSPSEVTSLVSPPLLTPEASSLVSSLFLRPHQTALPSLLSSEWAIAEWRSHLFLSQQWIATDDLSLITDLVMIYLGRKGKNLLDQPKQNIWCEDELFFTLNKDIPHRVKARSDN